jgi:hypothetical protein
VARTRKVRLSLQSKHQPKWLFFIQKQHSCRPLKKIHFHTHPIVFTIKKSEHQQFFVALSTKSVDFSTKNTRIFLHYAIVPSSSG